jgi:hypothetical protein
MTIPTMGISGVAGTAAIQGQHHHHGGAGRKAALDAAAKDLGMSTSDLQSKLSSGQTLQQLASQNKVDTKQLTSDMASAISSADPSVASDRANQIAARILAGPQTGSTPGA